MTENSRNELTAQRLNKASKLGVKVSFIIKTAELSQSRISCVLNGARYGRHLTQYLTDEEAEAINTALDKIKSAL